MVFRRKCPVCHEIFDTTDRSRKYCCEYCGDAAAEQRNESKRRDLAKPRKRPRTKHLDFQE